jgi:hypothetical protein
LSGRRLGATDFTKADGNPQCPDEHCVRGKEVSSMALKHPTNAGAPFAY